MFEVFWDGFYENWHFLKLLLVWLEGVFKYLSILCKMIINAIISLLWKGVIGTLGGIYRNFCGFQVSFFIDLKFASKKLHQNCLFYTTLILKNDIPHMPPPAICRICSLGISVPQSTSYCLRLCTFIVTTSLFRSLADGIV